MKNWEAALTDLNKVIELDPKYAEAYYNRSNAYLQLERTSEACTDMREAAKLGYDNAINYVAGLCN